jgi:hypothetical protein
LVISKAGGHFFISVPHSPPFAVGRAFCIPTARGQMHPAIVMKEKSSLGAVRGFGVVRVAEKVTTFFAARVNRADMFAAAHLPDRSDLAFFLDGMIGNFVLMGFRSRRRIGNVVTH